MQNETIQGHKRTPLVLNRLAKEQSFTVFEQGGGLKGSVAIVTKTSHEYIRVHTDDIQIHMSTYGYHTSRIRVHTGDTRINTYIKIK